MHTRRRFLFDSYLGLGSLALFDLLGAEAIQAAGSVAVDPLSPKPQHHPAKAKSCIFLFMEGGVSQMDTFEYKPALWKYAGQQMPQAARTVGEIATFSAAPNRVIPPSCSSSSTDSLGDGYRTCCRTLRRASMTWPSYTASKSTITTMAPRSITRLREASFRAVLPLAPG